jgi:hypothetical protein
MKQNEKNIVKNLQFYQMEKNLEIWKCTNALLHIVTKLTPNEHQMDPISNLNKCTQNVPYMLNMSLHT